MITGNSCEDYESVLGRLYESYSESNAMYDDEIKADFHVLYESIFSPKININIISFVRMRKLGCLQRSYSC